LKRSVQIHSIFQQTAIKLQSLVHAKILMLYIYTRLSVHEMLLFCINFSALLRWMWFLYVSICVPVSLTLVLALSLGPVYACCQTIIDIISISIVHGVFWRRAHPLWICHYHWWVVLTQKNWLICMLTVEGSSNEPEYSKLQPLDC